MPRSLYVGLMTGTSIDGLDACLASFDSGGVRELGHLHQPFAPELRRRILALARSGGSLEEAAAVDVTLGRASAACVTELLERSGTGAGAVRAIGSHGQTVLHRPHGDCPTSIQLGDPHVIAVATGIDTVGDFRRADVAAGGEGAPLAPAFHATVFASAHEERAVLNLGGIANVTRLAPDGDVTGFDTGPANILLDAWIARALGRDWDEDGAWAAGGHVDAELLELLRADPWFERPPPKSTGRERFDLDWIDHRLAQLDRAIAPIDVQATLAELTASTVADALAAGGPLPARLIVCGGGAGNSNLLRRLQARLPRTSVATSAEYGIDPRHVESLAFAWLARCRIEGRAGNLPGVTGARCPLVLGALVCAPPPGTAT